MSKIIKSISKEEIFTSNSKKIKVQSSTYYSVKTSVKGISGLPYSGYFAIIMLDLNEREIGRRIKWISDFSGVEKTYQIKFCTSSETKSIILSYRFNIETPVRSELKIEVEDLSLISPLTNSDHIEEYDKITEFKVPSFSPLSENEENKLENKITWLVASPRSGTTWLGTRLLIHEDNIIWHEPWIGLHLGLLRGALMPAIDFGESSYKFERVFDQQSTNGEYFFSPHHKNNWLPALRKLILSRTFSHTQTLQKNVIIKDPVGSNGIDILLESLPKSKIIFLIRDGRDEVDSRIDMHRSNSWAKLKTLSGETRTKAIDYYSNLWVVNNQNIKRAFNAHDENLKLLIKYENLRNNTLEELKTIYDFLEIRISDEEMKSIVNRYDFNNIPSKEKGLGKFNRAGKVGGWKNNFNSEEQELMNGIMGPTLKDMGYKV